jgi:cell division protein FtsL
MKELEERVAELEMSIREHVVSCRQETRQQNSRLRRVEAILISTAGATILLLVTIILRHTG